MRLHRAHEFGGVASFGPMLEQGDLLLRRHRFQSWIVIEKTLEGRHERRSARMLEVNERKIVVNHAEFLESLMCARTRLPRRRQHSAINFRALIAGPAKRFAPGREGEDWLIRGDPDIAFLEWDFVKIRLKKTRPPEIIDGLSRGHARADLPES